MKKQTQIICIILISIFIYFIASFIAWDFDPTTWKTNGRAAAITIDIAASLSFLIFTWGNTPNDENDRFYY